MSAADKMAEALRWIASVNAMDYEYQSKAREALAARAALEAAAKPEPAEQVEADRRAAWRRDAAVATLECLGYEWCGGALWTPPLAKPAPAEPVAFLDRVRTICAATIAAGPGVSVPIPEDIRAEMDKFMRGQPSAFDDLSINAMNSLAAIAAAPAAPAPDPEGTKCLTHEAIAAALTEGRPLNHMQRACLLGLVDADKRKQTCYDAAIQDAERYRWLRDPKRIPKSDNDTEGDGDGHILVCDHSGEDVLWMGQLDRAIDAAIAASKGGAA